MNVFSLFVTAQSNSRSGTWCIGFTDKSLRSDNEGLGFNLSQCSGRLVIFISRIIRRRQMDW